jgi:hypothetical protein
MALAEGLLKRVVELLRRQFLALFEIERHQVFVHLDDLVDDLGVGRPDGGEIRGMRVGMEEAVDDLRATFRRQVQWQAFGAEHLPHLLQYLLRLRVAAVDLVDDDEAA